MTAGIWRFVSAGPTTSIREEPYEADVIAYFGLRAVIGKGGMGPKTLAACQEHGAVYLHAVGGAATLIASYVKEVLTVYKKDELGVPEAFWVVRVEGFPAVVTMDAHGESLHEQMFAASAQKLAELIGHALKVEGERGRKGDGTCVLPFSLLLLPLSTPGPAACSGRRNGGARAPGPSSAAGARNPARASLSSSCTIILSSTTSSGESGSPTP